MRTPPKTRKMLQPSAVRGVINSALLLGATGIVGLATVRSGAAPIPAWILSGSLCALGYVWADLRTPVCVWRWPGAVRAAFAVLALGLAIAAVRLHGTAAIAALALGGVSSALAGRWVEARRPPERGERILVLGATPSADRLLTALPATGTSVRILGYVDDRRPEEIALTNGLRVLGRSADLATLVARHRATNIVVALEDRRGALPLQGILDCKLGGVQVEDWPSFCERLTGKIHVEKLRPSWLIFSEGFRVSPAIRRLKRLADLLVSLAILLLGWPVLALTALAIKLDTEGPVLFRQERVGQGGRVFSLVKFRTMRQNAEAATGPVWAEDADPRITPVGWWLRRTRLDELPQVINILKGEMSFIGPRPERPHFVAQLQAQIPYYGYRHTVRPGITGWAQVRYHYGATVTDALEKLQYDLYYIKNLSGRLDLRILLASIRVVLCGTGAR
jgi:sugar transferase (PEP-CTERM system associated)